MTLAAPAPAREAPPLTVQEDHGGALVLALRGDWLLGATPHPDQVVAALEARKPTVLRFETMGLARWDTGLTLFVGDVQREAAARGVDLVLMGLPPGLQRILKLATSVPGHGRLPVQGDPDFLESVGLTTLAAGDRLNATVDFIGGVAIAVARWLRGKASYRRVDLVTNLQAAGLEALPVVGLVSFLLGLILAFVGAIQLQLFDATIYTANLVGIAMVRDMAALMTAIVMAGRSGASYAAQLGTMQVNQEVDALTTLGISPMEFLVMPRVVALILMVPLLTVYAGVLGLIGGGVVGVGLLGLPLHSYYLQTVDAVSLDHMVGGLFKATTYGALIGTAGCFEGLRAERSSAGVGKATTTAVVNGIVLVISACGLYAVLFYFLGL